MEFVEVTGGTMNEKRREDRRGEKKQKFRRSVQRK
jgi:hypothetical protein